MSEQRKEAKEVILGNYKVLSRIGSGGTAAVYKAEDLSTGQLVAVKVLSRELAGQEAFVQKFLDEAVAAARISHPNVIRIHSIGEQEKKYHYFVMEYVESGSLARLLSGGRSVPPAQAVDYVRQAARGLQGASQFGIVHRDVKPSNLLLTRDGTVKVTDFGLAQLESGAPTPSGGRKAVGTPAYMSPEQAAFDAVDLRSDIYSLGATFFHLVTGRQPFQAKTPQEVIAKHRSEPAPSPHEINPSMPKSVCDVIAKMMAKSPFDRQQNYEELIADLARVHREAKEAASAGRERLVLLARRAAAFGLDNALIFGSALLITLVEERARFFTRWNGLGAALAIALVALTVYGAAMLARFGQTLGMMAMGLCLRDARGRRPWWGVTLVRSLALNSIYLFFLFPWDLLARAVFALWWANAAAALFRKDGQPWHDVLCGTAIIKASERERGR